MDSNDDIRTALADLKNEVGSIHHKIDEALSVIHSMYHETLFYLRNANMGTSTYVGDFTALTTIQNGYRMYVDTRSRDHGVHLMYGGRWEDAYTAAFIKLLRPGATVVDVGSNLGWYSMIAAPIVGRSGKIIAIEPNRNLANLLYASFEINGFRDFCEVFNVAAGERFGMLDLTMNIDRPGHAYAKDGEKFIPLGEETVSHGNYIVQSVVLDDLIFSRAEGFADAIKMDIEGFEGVALRGLERHLSSKQELRLIIEWNIRMNDSSSPKRETAALLDKHGFVPFRVVDDGEFVASRWDELIINPELVNIVLLRKNDPLVAL